VPEAGDPDRSAPSARDRHEGWLVAGAVGVVVLPLLVSVVRTLVDPLADPGGDPALIELRVRDVGDDTPLLGSYQRYGFNQPGPLWFYVLAVPYRLLGADYADLQVGALLCGIASLVVMVLVARRHGGLVMALWTSVVLAVLVHALGADWVASPWEPHGLTLACGALLLLTFDVVAGHDRSLPAVAVVATLLAQAHAVLVAYAVAMGAVAAVAVALRARRSPAPPPAHPADVPDHRDRSRRVRALAAAAGLLVVLWAPAGLEQVREDPGNVTAMVRSLRDPVDPLLGGADAWRAVSLQLGHRASWLGADVPLQPFAPIVDLSAVPVVPVGVVALGAAALAARRTRGPAWSLVAVVGVAVVVAVASLARLVGPLFEWIPAWTQVLGAGVWLAAGWCAHQALADRTRAPVRRVVVTALALALVGASAASVVDALDDRRRETLEVTAVRALAERAVPSLEELDGPVLVRSTATAELPFGDEGLGIVTLVLTLDRAGIDAVVDADQANRYGPHRAHPEQAAAELLLRNADDAPLAGYEPVATVDPLPRSLRAERERLAERVPGLVAGSLAERQRILEDPELAPLARRFAEIPDLPPLVLLVKDVA